MTYTTLRKNGICLHIGCGLVTAPGWISFDTSPSLRISQIPVIGRKLITLIGGPEWPKSVNYGDIVKGLKINENQCDLIYSSHVLEHLSISDFNLAMSNIYYYLKPGGIFRAVVPDLGQYIANYIKYHSDNDLIENAAHKFMEESYLGHKGKRSSIYNRLQEAFSNSRHQWMWDEASLRHAFTQHGFKNIRNCNYGDWLDERFTVVEHEDRFSNAICIEGTK